MLINEERCFPVTQLGMILRAKYSNPPKKKPQLQEEALKKNKIYHRICHHP